MWLHNAFVLKVSIVGRNQYGFINSCPHALLVRRIAYGYISPAFLVFAFGERSIWLHVFMNPAFSGCPKTGRYQHGHSTIDFCVLGKEQYGYITPNPYGGKKSIGLHVPCRRGAAVVGRH